MKPDRRAFWRGFFNPPPWFQFWHCVVGAVLFTAVLIVGSTAGPLSVLIPVGYAFMAGVCLMEARRRRKPRPPTATTPCPICQTAIPLTVHTIPTLVVRIDRTDLALHLMTHEEKR